MFLCFGEVELWKVLVYFEMKNVPLTGLEFAHESEQRSFDNFNLY